MPDPARIAQAQVLEIPVTIQGEKTAAETGQREPFAESTKTTLTFDNGAVLKLQARVKAGESVSLRNEKSGKEIQCKVLEAPAEGQLGYTDLEFLETVHDFWEGHAEQAAAAGEKPGVGVAKSEAEPERVASAEPAPEKHVPARLKAAALVAEAVAALETVVAQPAVQAPRETEAEADNSLAMMSAAASEASLPPTKAPAAEEKPQEREPQAQIPKGRLREELVPAHEMVPANPSAPTAPIAATAPSTPSATVPTGEQIDAALRVMEGAAARPQGAAEPSDAKDQANLAALMAREARLAKYAALKDKAASQIGRGQPPPGASKAAVAAEGQAGASVEGEAEVEAGPPKLPLSERLTTGKNAVIVEIVAGVAIVVALGFVWHAVRGLIFHPGYRPVAAAAPVKKTVPPKAPLVAVQTPAAPVAQVPAATPPAPVSAPAATAASPTAVASAPVAKAPAPTPSVVAGAPASKIVQPSPGRGESAEETGPRVVEPPPVSEEPKPAEPVVAKAPEDIPAKILSAPQPGLPSWAKTLDVASVVKLDAVIDEKGNLGETRIVAGPRLLERAAQQAVQLWIFQPAHSDGKPAASHMVLTVEFQR